MAEEGGNIGSPSRRRRWVPVLVAASVVWMVAVCLILFLLVSKYTYRKQFDHAVSELEKNGLSTSVEELNESRSSVPDEENAALLYKKVIAIIGDGKKEREKGTIPIITYPAWIPESSSEAFPPDALDASRSFLAEKREALALLHEAAALSQSDYGMVLKDYDTPLPDLPGVRRATRVLALAAWVAAEDGNADEALGRVYDGLAAAHSLDDEPSNLCALVAFACRSISVAALTRVLARTEPSDAALRTLQERIEASAAQVSLKAAFSGEVALFVDLCRQTAAGDSRMWRRTDDGGVQDARASLFGLGSVARRETVIAAPVIIDLYNIEKNPSPLTIRAVAVDTYTSRIPPASLRAVYLSINLSGLVEQAAAMRAKMHAAAAGVAALRYMRQTGALPQNIEDLVPDYLDAVPADPFSGAPLVFRRSGHGLLIYTVARNLTDDNGHGFLLKWPGITDGGPARPRPDDSGFQLEILGDE